MSDAVFFYGTLMTGFERRRRLGIEGKLLALGRGTIRAQLFDLGIYPAAVRSSAGLVRGEVYEMTEPETVLEALDALEGFSPDHPDQSLYLREQVEATLDNGESRPVWAYFYNAPLGGAQRIPSGDYLEHVRVR